MTLESLSVTHGQSQSVSSSSDRGGGAVFVAEGATLVVAKSSFISNVASDGGDGSGGAIFFLQGSPTSTLMSTTFDRNIAGGDGGAIAVVRSSSLKVIASVTFAGGDGGGVALRDGLQSLRFVHNLANKSGGGLSVNNSMPTFESDVTFVKNLERGWAGRCRSPTARHPHCRQQVQRFSPLTTLQRSKGVAHTCQTRCSF